MVQTCSKYNLKYLNWRPVDLHGSWLRALRTSQGNLFGGQTQSRIGSSFENLQGSKQKAEIILNGRKYMGRFNLLDLKYNLTQGWGMAFGRGFPLMSMARGDFEKGRRSFQMPQGYLKDFSKEIFPSEKHLVLSPNKKGKPPRPKPSLG